MAGVAKRYRITGGRVVTPRGIFEPGEVLVRGERLLAVAPAGEIERSRGEEVIAADGHWIVPGFIDLHLHGGAGADTTDATEESLIRLSCFHAEHGTTGFLATTVSASRELLCEVIHVIGRVRKRGTGGARLLGAHLEGPFLNPDYAGAHRIEYLRLPNLAEAAAFLEAAPGCIKMVTLAPELPGALETIAFLRRHGVVVAAGHSGATFAEAKRAYRRGLRHIAHLFNAMRPLHHREPGLVGFALAEGGPSFELIADGHHLHPAAVKMALRLAGGRRPVLVTDAVSVCGREDGEYEWAGQKVVAWQGVVRLADGRLAGSLVTLEKAVRNVAQWLGLSLDQVLPLASANPARVLGREEDMGALESGKLADLVVLDAEHRVCLTMVGGEVVFSRRDFYAP